jgi:hypothetical protein
MLDSTNEFDADNLNASNMSDDFNLQLLENTAMNFPLGKFPSFVYQHNVDIEYISNLNNNHNDPIRKT